MPMGHRASSHVSLRKFPIHAGRCRATPSEICPSLFVDFSLVFLIFFCIKRGRRRELHRSRSILCYLQIHFFQFSITFTINKLIDSLQAWYNSAFSSSQFSCHNRFSFVVFVKTIFHLLHFLFWLSSTMKRHYIERCVGGLVMR